MISHGFEDLVLMKKDQLSIAFINVMFYLNFKNDWTQLQFLIWSKHYIIKFGVAFNISFSSLKSEQLMIFPFPTDIKNPPF